MEKPSSISVNISTEAAAQFLTDALGAFAQAAQRNLSEHYLDIAGQTVHIKIAGSTLEPYLSRALRHRSIERPASSVDLTISAFDSTSTGVKMPRPVWPIEAYGPRDEILGLNSERILAMYNVGLGILCMLDVATGQGFYWIRDGQWHPQVDSAAPFRSLLHWWMRSQGKQFIHAGAVGKQNGGVLLVGEGGSGKSTSSLAALESGWQFAGDNYVLVGLEPQPTVYNIYQSAALHVDHLHKNFPGLERAIGGYTGITDTMPRSKAILLLGDYFPDRLPSSFPLRAIVFPKLMGGDHPHLRRIDAKTSLDALTPSTVQQLRLVRPADFQNMLALVRSLPSYALELGGGIDEVPGVLAELVD